MRNKYSRMQILLHWISALVIIWATVTGFWVAMFDSAAVHKNWVGFINVSLTTVFIPIFILRVGCALRLSKPNDRLLNFREEKLAAIGHFLLYLNIGVVLITGVLMMDRPINVFNWFTLPQPIADQNVTSLFNRTHIISCLTLSLLIIGHIFAVIKHHLQGKALLRRMCW